MSKRTQTVVLLLAILAVAGAVGLVLTGGPDAAHAERRVLAAVAGPETADESLQAQIFSRGTDHGAEVRISGVMHGRVFHELVFRSQESPDLLRLGWASPDHLVISVPQYSTDAGRAAGAGDPSFFCGVGSREIQVSCDSYPVGRR